MKKIFFMLAAVGFISLSQAQNEVDALRYSQLTFGGTARGMGIGGALGALGADFTSLSVNPAGIGLYRSSEIMFTPAFYNSVTNSEYLSEKNKGNKYNFNFTNWGIVLTNLRYEEETPKTNGWVATSFGFGVNRLANFRNEISFSGFNTKNSLLDKYAEEANYGSGTTEQSMGDNDNSAFPFGASLAYKTYLINPNYYDTISNDPNRWYSAVMNGNIQQFGIITTRGGIDEYVVSFGANYNNKLFMGGTLGLPYIHYVEERTYTEEDTKNTVNTDVYFIDTSSQPSSIGFYSTDFKSFTQTDYLKSTGMGVNFKFGLIYKINDIFRLGGAIHSPTFYALKDEYSTTMESHFAPDYSYNESSPSGSFEYTLTTPWRLVGSAAFVYKKLGFLSVDYEFVDYSQAFFDFGSNPEDKSAEKNVNRSIGNNYGPASNIRIGGEVNYDMFRFRAGYGFFGTPFKSGMSAGDFNNARQNISLGIGFREQYYYFDFGYVRTMTKEFYLPYSLNTQVTEGAKNTISKNNFLITFGVKF